MFKYLSKIEDKNYVENFPVPLNENEEVVLDRFYTSSYYDCCKEEFKRISLNCKFEISEPYYRYGMRTDYYGEDIYHIVVDSYTNGDVIVDKYYRYYTNEELTLAQVESYMGSSHWKSTSHWSGNFVPDNKYKECKKFELDLVFFTGTRMFFSYDSMRNLDKVRIYEKTPWWGAHIDIVGLE